MSPDITCIITGHREDHVCVPSLRSFEIAVNRAEDAGFRVEVRYYLDNPNDVTQSLFENYARSSENIKIVSFADQGLVRNDAIANSNGKYIAFLDADDLWMSNWLVTAIRYLKTLGPNTIAHPQFNYFFESTASIFCQMDAELDGLDLDLFRFVNYWDALCVCERSIYERFPFQKRDIANGWAFEDWSWNCETVAAGIVHKVVPNTVIFKRRQKLSQTIKASMNKSKIRQNRLSKYTFTEYID